jgi:hypothetical protein
VISMNTNTALLWKIEDALVDHFGNIVANRMMADIEAPFRKRRREAADKGYNVTITDPVECGHEGDRPHAQRG